MFLELENIIIELQKKREKEKSIKNRVLLERAIDALLEYKRASEKKL